MQGRHDVSGPTNILTGTIQGKTIRLESDPGLPDGQEVSVIMTPRLPSRPLGDEEAREALRRAAGTWAEEGDELDSYLEWNRQQRRINRPEVAE